MNTLLCSKPVTMLLMWCKFLEEFMGHVPDISSQPCVWCNSGVFWCSLLWSFIILKKKRRHCVINRFFKKEKESSFSETKRSRKLSNFIIRNEPAFNILARKFTETLTLFAKKKRVKKRFSFDWPVANFANHSSVCVLVISQHTH